MALTSPPSFMAFPGVSHVSQSSRAVVLRFGTEPGSCVCSWYVTRYYISTPATSIFPEDLQTCSVNDLGWDDGTGSLLSQESNVFHARTRETQGVRVLYPCKWRYLNEGGLLSGQGMGSRSHKISDTINRVFHGRLCQS